MVWRIFTWNWFHEKLFPFLQQKYLGASAIFLGAAAHNHQLHKLFFSNAAHCRTIHHTCKKIQNCIFILHLLLQKWFCVVRNNTISTPEPNNTWILIMTKTKNYVEIPKNYVEIFNILVITDYIDKTLDF